MSLGASPLQAFMLIHLSKYLRGYVSGFIMAFIIFYSQHFFNFFLGDRHSMNFSMILTPYITSGNQKIASTYIFIYTILGIGVMQLGNLLLKKYALTKEEHNK